MTLGTINIDDRNYEQLLGVLKQHIPVKDWRDHNPSDPGIMLLELLAWLGEMSLYRMNRIPAYHRNKFLKLIADPPQPATTLITFTATLDPAKRIDTAVVPIVNRPLFLAAGTRVATDFSNGRRYVFETLETVRLALPAGTLESDPLQEVSVHVRAREFVIVDNQTVGISDGTADQVFALQPPRNVIETPDHPPQMSIPTGFSPAVASGGKLGEDSGIVGIIFDEADLEQALLLSYDAGTTTLTLESRGGISESVSLLAAAIASGARETVVFPLLNLNVILGEKFNKAADVIIDNAVVTISGGSGAIDPVSIKVVATRGMPLPQSSLRLTFSRLTTPAMIEISTADQLSAVVDLSSSGNKRVYLDDRWGRGIQVEFQVTSAFNGSEESAQIDLKALNNLLFLGTAVDVSHSPWSEILMDFVYRSSDYDPNPQIRVSSGFSSALVNGGKLNYDAGFAAINYPKDSMEQSFVLRYQDAARHLSLRRPDGSTDSVTLSASPIAAGATETANFTLFGVEVILNDRFDKTRAIDIDSATVAIDPPVGTGVIAPGSLQIVSTLGLIFALQSPVINFSNLANPEKVVVSADRGLRGVVDFSTTGLKIIRLRDVWQRGLDIQVSVTTAFTGNEQTASIELAMLENLFILGTLWDAQRSLRTRASQVPTDATHPTPVQHCQIDPFDRSLRFGNGEFASIPPNGTDIIASYRVLQGPEALLRENELKFLLDPAPLFPAETLQFENAAGEGGLRFFSPDSRMAEALIDLNRTYRLITAEDFERVLLYDFNEFDIMAQAAPNVLTPQEVRSRRAADPTIKRAVAMMNRTKTLEEKRGHVAILVLTRFDPSLDPNLLHNESISLAEKQQAVNLAPSLEKRILNFLDDRRLITTHPSLISTKLIAVIVTAHVIIEQGRNLAQMTETIRNLLHNHFDIYTGYFTGTGWPLGRTVYRSQIFQLLEGIEGVDHVDSLALSPADSNLDVPLAFDELPVLQKLNLGVDRS